MTRAFHIVSINSVSATTSRFAAAPARALRIGDLRRETNGDALATRCALH